MKNPIRRVGRSERPRATANVGQSSNALLNKTQTLRTIEREITQLEDELWSLGKTALQKALRYGELLHLAKALLKHGEWLPWLKKHVRFSQPAAWHYMQLWKRRHEPELVKLFNTNNLAGITEAYSALGLPWGESCYEAEVSGCQRVVERLTKWEAMTMDLLKLNLEAAIGEFIAIISRPDATPEQQMMWEVFVREVKTKLKAIRQQQNGGRE